MVVLNDDHETFFLLANWRRLFPKVFTPRLMADSKLLKLHAFHITLLAFGAVSNQKDNVFLKTLQDSSYQAVVLDMDLGCVIVASQLVSQPS